MGMCQRCGSKTGFLNKEIRCEKCRRQFCGKCRDWRVAEFQHSNDLYRIKEKDISVCSEKCVFDMYGDFIARVKSSTPIHLENSNNIGIEIYEVVDDPNSIYIDNIKAAPKYYGRLKELIPALVPIYDKIRQDLILRGVEFKETLSDYP